VVCDDFAKYLDFDIFVDILDNLMRLRRKDNLAVWMSTQTGEDILNTKIARLILESCVTRVLFPNPAAMDAENDAIYQDAW
jgi:type IV secretory pathway VirB4 component